MLWFRRYALNTVIITIMFFQWGLLWHVAPPPRSSKKSPGPPANLSLKTFWPKIVQQCIFQQCLEWLNRCFSPHSSTGSTSYVYTCHKSNYHSHISVFCLSTWFITFPKRQPHTRCFQLDWGITERTMAGPGSNGGKPKSKINCMTWWKTIVCLPGIWLYGLTHILKLACCFGDPAVPQNGFPNSGNQLVLHSTDII